VIHCKPSIISLALSFASLSLAVATPGFAQGSGQGMLQGTRAEKFAKIQQLMKARQEANSASSSNKNVIITLQDWTDSAHKRTIPIKIYQPRIAGPWPVVLFSHGLGGSRESASYFCEAMAENGYLTLALQHPGSDSSVWMGALKEGRDFHQDMKQAATGENLRTRVDDVNFVIGQLERLNSAAGPWHGMLDLAKLGCSGHSFGAGTTMAIAGQTYGTENKKITATNPKVKAAIYMSPPVNLFGRDPKTVYGSIKIPGMLMTGTEDNSPIINNTAEDRLRPYKSINAPDQYLVNFNGGDHMIFGGRKSRMSGKRDGSKDDRFHVLINKLSVAFFDAYLKGDVKQKEWLKHNAATYLGKEAEFECK
jgi:predicted dienelactone hydrolase